MLFGGAWIHGHYSRTSAVQAAGLENYREEYRCGDDCGAFRAGGDWASDREVMNGRDCPRSSEAFYQGCLEEVATALANAAPEPPDGD